MSEPRKDEFTPELARPLFRASNSIFLSTAMALAAPVFGCWIGGLWFKDGMTFAGLLAAPFLLGVGNLFLGAWGWARNLAGLLLICGVLAAGHWRTKFVLASLLCILVVWDVYLLHKSMES